MKCGQIDIRLTAGVEALLKRYVRQASRIAARCCYRRQHPLVDGLQVVPCALTYTAPQLFR